MRGHTMFLLTSTATRDLYAISLCIEFSASGLALKGHTTGSTRFIHICRACNDTAGFSATVNVSPGGHVSA